MFSAWGHIAVKYRRIIPIVIALVILSAYVFIGAKLDSRLSSEGWDDPHSSSTKAAQIEAATFGRDNSADALIVVTARPGTTVDDPAQFAAAKSFIDGIVAAHPEQIAQVNTYFDKKQKQLVNDDHTVAFAALGMKGDGQQTLKDFRTVFEGQEFPVTVEDGMTIELAGATAIADALDKGMADDVSRAEMVALPVVGLLLLLVFGSAMAAGLPLLIGVLSILGSLSVLSLLATWTQVNVFAQSVVTLLGLGLAIDYGLFMVSRFREELKAGASVEEATVTATATAGKTVVFSAAMVAASLSGLLLFPQAFLKSVAYGAISAVGLAAVLSVTLLPSIFAMMGHNIDLGRVRLPGRARRTSLEASPWSLIPAWAMRHASAVVLVIVGGLLALTLPLIGVRFGGINETYLPPANQARVAQEHFDTAFPSLRTDPIKLVITGADNNAVVQIYGQANEVQGLTSRFSAIHPTTDGTTVLAAGIADRRDNAAVVEQLRALDVPEGVELYIGGTPALEVESIEALFNTLPMMALYIVAATFILMALAFGSLILPAKAIIMTILGMGTTLGVLTAIFVGGFGSNLLGFSPGPLMSPVLVLIMAIIYGLSTDYEVFLVSRMVEAKERGATTDQAIRYGTAHTGSIITAAAVIMIVVCGAFGFSDIVMMKYIAFGMIVALILDATVIRMLLVPAVMHLLAEDNWWAPNWVKRAAQSVGHAPQVSTTMVTPRRAATPPRVRRDAEARPDGLTVAELAQLVQQRAQSASGATRGTVGAGNTVKNSGPGDNSGSVGLSNSTNPTLPNNRTRTILPTAEQDHRDS